MDLEGSGKISKPKVLEALHPPKVLVYKDWQAVTEGFRKLEIVAVRASKDQ
jgi:hypothetical protein